MSDRASHEAYEHAMYFIEKLRLPMHFHARTFEILLNDDGHDLLTQKPTLELLHVNRW